MINKIAIGTAQFGLKYGVSNKSGKVAPGEAEKILDSAAANGIDTLDTASAYGDSEEMLGAVLTSRNLHFNIVTKLPPDVSSGNLRTSFNASLERLQTKKIYGCLIHHAKDFFQDEHIWQLLIEEKEAGKVKKIGFSLYNTSDLERLLEKDLQLDMVQFPYNLLDRKFENHFRTLKERNVEIHVRSVFLQGLFLMQPEEIPPKLKALKPALEEMRTVFIKYNVPILQGALQFVVSDSFVDKAVVGTESYVQLNEIIRAATLKVENNILEATRTIKVSHPDLLNPMNW